MNNGTLIGDLALTTRSFRALRQANILTVGDLCGASEKNLKRIPNLGRKSIAEIKEVLAEAGKSLSPEWKLPADYYETLDQRVRKIVRDEIMRFRDAGKEDQG